MTMNAARARVVDSVLSNHVRGYRQAAHLGPICSSLPSLSVKQQWLRDRHVLAGLLPPAVAY
ncbi:hypothetical protein C7449_104127 [Mycoplana dimorpha]|uniref:Uncharacterized protein n=1 Tax=Mycoplana dimorpha TaxID=28320 RepID=A0A2T5B801_MYCDI|nr:hypothetical protein C7449_104127 [Mycoplana dimorpha]